MNKKMDIKNAQKKFIHREICALCFIAAFGMARRFPTYRDNIERELVKEFLRNELFDLLSKYENNVEENKHIANIDEFKEKLSKKFSARLINNDIGFGRAQKLINLYLKFAWSSGLISEPPHCPVDSIVITELNKLKQDTVGMRSWIFHTKEDYSKVIETIRNVKGQHSIAEWELITFNQRA